jgi:hypothetical protein
MKRKKIKSGKRTHLERAKKVDTKDKCEQGIPLSKCFYRRDLGSLAEQFKTNEEAHKEILNKFQIKLNGGDETLPFEQVIRDIWHATRSERATVGLRQSFKKWMDNTATGRFLRTKAGKIIGWIFIAWFLFSSLYTLGIINVSPIEFFIWAFKKIFPSLLI